ncbi:uncharacterized protein LOC127874815 [Dreissena polymorpha]|nr:uncharacterized protein LOC127874815 [Dreissena polymorpha]
MKLSSGLSVVTLIFIGFSSVLVTGEKTGDGKVELTSSDSHPEYGNEAQSDEYGKRNFGRWKNLRWQIQQSANNQGQGPDSYAIDKRFALGGNADRRPYNFRLPYYLYNPDSESQIYPVGFESDYPFDDIGYDKRHSSRWNIILRKLGALSTPDESTAGKRSASRWRFIQNKLNQLGDKPDLGTSKRNLGRWRNTN